MLHDMGRSQQQRFTILGGAGFVGSHLVAHLRARGYECLVPERDQVLRLKPPLGHVVYCIGLTADFRSRPFDTVEAHTSLFAAFLRQASFESLLYLSSARIYQHADTGEESASFSADPTHPSDLYNLSKMTAECLCLSLDTPRVRIARLSNVYGPDFASENFLTSIVRDAVERGSVRLEVHPDGAKDYVVIDDVTAMLERIALDGRRRLYNLAAGRNVSNGEIMTVLRKLTGCTVEWGESAALLASPPISIARLKEEFGYSPRQLKDELPSLVALFQKQLGEDPGRKRAAQLGH
jgi:nucleoside-diphosphate-sugar epimerase